QMDKLTGGKKAEKVSQMLRSTPDAMSSPADIMGAFQPVHLVVAAGNPKWVGDKNKAYIDALSQLQHSMEDIAHAQGRPDPPLLEAAKQNANKAMDAAPKMASQFQSVGVGGLDKQVVRLLEEPIQYAIARIPPPPPPPAPPGEKINVEFSKLCADFKGI